MSKKDRGAFQRKRAQKAAKQKAKKAKALRSARHDVPLAYTGSRYRSNRYVVPLMTAEVGVLTADNDAGRKLLDSDVRAALAVMVKHLHTGPQDLFTALNALREIELNEARQRQIVLSVTDSWLEFFQANRPLPRADLVGILRTLVNSLDVRTEMHPSGRGYLRYLGEFLPQAIAALANDPQSHILEVVDDEDEDEEWQDDELYDERDLMLNEDDAIDVTHRPAGGSN